MALPEPHAFQTDIGAGVDDTVVRIVQMREHSKMAGPRKYRSQTSFLTRTRISQEHRLASPKLQIARVNPMTRHKATNRAEMTSAR